MEKIWFDSWESIIRTLCLTTLGYAAMVLLLRLSGKRTLSKMNAFDFIITIALGSVLASVALNKDISLADGLTAFILLIGFQFLLTWLTVRIKAVRAIMTSNPALLFYKGNFLHEAMGRERITVDEIYSAGRQKGFSTLDEIYMIVLETTGEMTIIEKRTAGDKVTFKNVEVEP